QRNNPPARTGQPWVARTGVARKAREAKTVALAWRAEAKSNGVRNRSASSARWSNNVGWSSDAPPSKNEAAQSVAPSNVVISNVNVMPSASEQTNAGRLSRVGSAPSNRASNSKRPSASASNSSNAAPSNSALSANAPSASESKRPSVSASNSSNAAPSNSALSAN